MSFSIDSNGNSESVIPFPAIMLMEQTTNIIPRMGIDRLLDGYQSIMKEIYCPKYYYRRVGTLLKELKVTNINHPISIQRFFSFFRAAFRLGVLGKECFHYRQLILWTLICKPRQISMAVTL